MAGDGIGRYDKSNPTLWAWEAMHRTGSGESSESDLPGTTAGGLHATHGLAGLPLSACPRSSQ